MTSEYEILDIHHHFGVSPVHDESVETTVNERVQKHIDQMKTNGISGAILLPPPNFPNPNGLEDTKAVNDQMAAIREEYSDWFPVAAGTVNLVYAESGIPEIDRALADLELDALVWHNRFHGVNPDDTIMFDFVERASNYDVPIHLHAYVESDIDKLWRIFRLVENFPDMTFVIHDVFSGYSQGQHVQYRASDFDNVLFDTAAASFLTLHIENFSEKSSVHKLIFGTDYYTDFPIQKSPEITAIEETSLSDSDKKTIFAENFKDLYGL